MSSLPVPAVEVPQEGRTPTARPGAAERLPLSVVILARNEERRIGRCLASVQWAAELIVVDGMSQDRTKEICERFGAQVISHAFEGSFAQERNLGMERARHEWVLQLDADDVVTPAFRDAVSRLLAAPQPHDAFKFRRKSYLLGRFMRYGGWHHYLPNLVRRERVRYEGLVHERPVLQGTIGQLDADVEHHPCESLAGFLDRHNRYTSLGAMELVARTGPLSERELRARLLGKPRKTFWKTYIKKQGFREGLHGLVFSLFFAGVELIKWAKVWEHSLAGAQAPQRAAAPSARPARPQGRETLSVVLMTKNEEARLAACLDHVGGWADEIVIIDDLSTDRTVEIARGYTDQVFSFASEDNHDRQWNRGIERATGEWILHIDADEVVTPPLRDAIDRRLADAAGYDAFEMMRKNVFLGRAMRQGGWYHRHLVLFRRQRARCVGRGIHVRLHVDGRIGFLDAEIEHHPFSSITQFIGRQNHYTTVEVQGLRAERGVLPIRAIVYQLSVRPAKLFWKSYRKNQGRREGLHGLVFGLLYAFVHIMLWAKYWELTGATPAGHAHASPTPNAS